jgi:hypothetical protein
MMARPTTDQILEDCARDLRELVLPAVDDPTITIHLQMMEQLLRSCAVRAAHEIAWMAEESAEMETFVESVVASQPGARDAADLLQVARRHHPDRVDLDAQVANYSRVGQAFSAALAHALDGDHPAAAQTGRDLILARCRHEDECRPHFYFPGRT